MIWYQAAESQITCTDVNAVADRASIYKLDVDGDGVKDFWFYVVQPIIFPTPPPDEYIIGMNGSEIEVDAPGGTDANRLEINNQIGNNYWNDTAYLRRTDLTGNFYGGSNETGYVGLRLLKNGNYFHAFVRISTEQTSEWGEVQIFQSGFNSAVGSPLQAGQCVATNIQVVKQSAIELRIEQNQLHFSLQHYSENEEYRIEILDASGRRMLYQSIQQNESRLSLNDLPGGVYVATVLNGNGNLVARRKIFYQPD